MKKMILLVCLKRSNNVENVKLLVVMHVFVVFRCQLVLFFFLQIVGVFSVVVIAAVVSPVLFYK